MRKIEDQISLLNEAKSTDEIFAKFTKIINSYGYDKVSYGCATDCPSIGLSKRHGHISSFPADWLSHYAKNGLSEVDPVHMHALRSKAPAFWSKCEEKAAPESIQLMRDAGDVGLKSGVIIPLHDFGNEVSMVSASRNETPQEETYETLAAINLLSVYFYEGYKSFLKKPVRVELSMREHEILKWAAEGKTDPEIADIIDLSVPAVRYHWNNIFRKLSANSRVYAVTRAIQAGMVTPYKIRAGS